MGDGECHGQLSKGRPGKVAAHVWLCLSEGALPAVGRMLVSIGRPAQTARASIV